jgi:hypothetical protein
MRRLLVLGKFSVDAKPEVCGSSIELRMTVGGVEDDGGRVEESRSVWWLSISYFKFD